MSIVSLVYVGPLNDRAPMLAHRAVLAAGVDPSWVCVRAEDGTGKAWLYTDSSTPDPRMDVGPWLDDPTDSEAAAVVVMTAGVCEVQSSALPDSATMSAAEALGYIKRAAGSTGRSGVADWMVEPASKGWRVIARDPEKNKIRAWDLDVATLSVSSVKL